MAYRSITLKLMIFLIVSGIFFSGISNYLNANYLLEHYDQEVHKKNQQIIDSTYYEFENEIKAVESVVNTLSLITEDRFKDIDEKAPAMDLEEAYYEDLFSYYLEGQESISNSVYIYFSPDLDGDIHDVWLHRSGEKVVREAEIPLQRYLDNDNMTWFFGPKNSGYRSWVAPYYNRFGEHITSYVTPVYSQGYFIGIIGMYLQLDTVKEKLSSLTYYDEDQFWVLNGQGEVIYHRDHEEGLASSEFFSWEDQEISNKSTIDGQSFYTYTRSTTEGWQFMYSIPVNVISEARNKVILAVTVIFLLTLLVTSLLLWVFLRPYKKMFSTIITALKEIKNGDLGHRIQLSTNDEIGLMVNAINESNESLEKTMAAKDQLAFYNHISGVRNRNSLIAHLETCFDEDRQLALVYVDMDGFKYINDMLGYIEGDKFIAKIGHTLEEHVGEDIDIFHISIDEFVFVMDGHWTDENLMVFSRDILSKFGRNIIHESNRFFVTFSIGIVRKNREMTEIEDMFRAADMALGASRKLGRNRAAFYDSKMYDKLLALNILERDFAIALKKDEFVLHYQPKVSLVTGKVESMEALVRWEHPTKGLIFPNDFIDFAEKSGLICQLGDIVLAKACRQLKLWQEQGEEILQVAVNISLRQLEDNNFVESVTNIIENMGIDPQLIEIEITESMFIGDSSRYISKIRTLKTFGIKVSLDDFGSGYSSLRSIHDLPIDTLKIDKSLVDVCLKSQKIAILLQTIIEMAHRLSYKVVAEGVEVKEQLAVFEDLSCDYIQGYYFSKPLTPEKFIEYCHSVNKGSTTD